MLILVQKYYYQADDGANRERVGKLTVRRSIIQSCWGGEDPWPGTDPWNFGCGLGQNEATGADNVKQALWAQLHQCPNERDEWNQYVDAAFVPYPSKTVLTHQNAIYLMITPPDVQESYVILIQLILGLAAKVISHVLARVTGKILAYNLF